MVVSNEGDREMPKFFQIRYLLAQSRKRFRDRFLPNSTTFGSPSGTNGMTMRDFGSSFRRNSETCFTQMGTTTLGPSSRMGSRCVFHGGEGDEVVGKGTENSVQ